jgi:hypothetical protein
MTQAPPRTSGGTACRRPGRRPGRSTPARQPIGDGIARAPDAQLALAGTPYLTEVVIAAITEEVGWRSTAGDLALALVARARGGDAEVGDPALVDAIQNQGAHLV